MLSFLKEWELWAALAGLLVVMSPWLFLGQTLFFRDIHLLYAPTARIVHDQLHSGELSLWEPSMHGGEPLLGNPNRSLLYPSRLIYSVLPPITGLNWEIGLHLLLGAVGTYLLCRALGLARPGAAFAAIVVALCGFSLSVTNNIGRLFAFHWMPLIFLWGHLLGLSRQRRWFILLTLGMAIQWLSASIELILLTAAILLSWQVALVSIGALRRRLLLCLVSFLLGLMIAAIQVIPAAYVIARSPRGHEAGVGHSLVWSVRPLRYLEMVMPGVLGPLGTASPPESYWGARLVDEGYPYIQSLYVGLAPVVLALAVLLAGRRTRLVLPIRVLLGTGAALALWLACGRFVPGIEMLAEHLPGAGALRYPVKLVAAAMVPIAILAAGAIHELFEGQGVGPSRVRAALTCSALVSVVIWSMLMMSDGLLMSMADAIFARSDEDVVRGVRGSATHTTIVMVLMALVAWWGVKERRRLASRLVVLIVLIDLGLAARAVLLTAPSDLLRLEPALLGRIRSEIGTGRLYREPDPSPLEVALEEDSAAALCRWRIEMLSSYLAAGYGVPMIFHDDDPFLARQGVRLIGDRLVDLSWAQKAQVLSAAGVTLVLSPRPLSTPALEHIGRVAAFASASYHLYRATEARPPAWIVHEAISVASQRDAAALMLGESIALERAVVLEGPVQPGAASTDWLDGSAPEPIRWLSRETDRWELQVEMTRPGWLVLTEVHDPGWKARVNGRPVEVLRANGVFSAIRLEPGSHRITRAYRPSEVWLGLAVSLVGVMLLAACARLWPFAPVARVAATDDGAVAV